MKTPRRLPLPACCAALFALAAPSAAVATTWPVTNCNDSGAGSLRAVIDAPTTLSGDTVSLSGLACSTITLSTGAIVVGQHSLILSDDNGRPTRITGRNGTSGVDEVDRIFTHTGTGTLELSNLQVEDGAPNAYLNKSVYGGGGCIYSAGNLVLLHSSVSSCRLIGRLSADSGGGIFALGKVTAKYSRVSNNEVVNGGTYIVGVGGGIAAYGLVNLSKSAVAYNMAGLLGGGVVALAGAAVYDSTISGNNAQWDAGLQVSGDETTDTLLIRNSTISGNISSHVGSSQRSATGVMSYLPTTVQNSTIAFNVGFGALNTELPGMQVANASGQGSIQANLQSSILANNYGSYGTVQTERDFYATSQPGAVVAVSSTNSIVRVSTLVDPVATVSTACPLLGPLRFNGGLTQTHKLLSGSPALDAGDNVAGLPDDQRGEGHPRVNNAIADIGAYEVDQGDVVFDANFEGCLPLPWAN